MPRKGYRSLTIPLGLYEKIEKFMNNNEGFVTVSEVVRVALREFLKERR